MRDTQGDDRHFVGLDRIYGYLKTDVGRRNMHVTFNCRSHTRVQLDVAMQSVGVDVHSLTAFIIVA